jgi:hypothetical protein
MERAWGIAFAEEGYDAEACSIQKYYLHPQYNPKLLFEKNFYLR